MTLTWSRFVAPTGYVLQGLGVMPAVCTSGDDDPAHAISVALEDRDRASRRFGAWRTPGLKDENAARSMRDACPAQRRRGGVEVTVAKRLIGAPTLYARALGMSSALAEASR